MAGKSALLADVAGFYTAFGLAPAEGQPETEDHVGAELEVMSALSVKEAWAVSEAAAAGLDITRAAQRAFVDDHLGRWAGTFAGRVAGEATSGFLSAAAELLSAWMAQEGVRLAITPAQLDGVQAAEEAPFACPMAPRPD